MARPRKEAAKMASRYVSTTVTQELFERINKCAQAEKRLRAAWVRVTLERAVAAELDGE